MGDKIIIVDMQFLYGYLWQIDLLNENTKEQARMFVNDEELQSKMSAAKAKEKSDNPELGGDT